MTHTSRDPGFGRRIFDWVRESRPQQDNDSVVSRDYGRFASLADLFRQIGYDGGSTRRSPSNA